MDVSDQLFEDLGLADLSPDKKQALAAQLAELVQLRMADKLSSQLDEATLAQLDQLADQAQDTAVLARIEELVPNYGELLQQTIEETKQEMKQGVEAVQSRLNQAHES